MLSKSYKEVLKASQQVKLYRALFSQTQRTFTAHASAVKPSSSAALNASIVILNKELNYLHSDKVSATLKPSDDFIPRHLGNDSKNT